MTRKDAKLKTLARLVDSLEVELDLLEGSFHAQFDSTSSLQDKLSASKRARSALTKARRLCDDISHTLFETEE